MINILFILSVIVLTSLWIHGITISRGENMLLSFITDWHKRYFDRRKKITWTKYFLHKLAKPLYACQNCMASIHGVLIYFTLGRIVLHQTNILEIIICCVCTVSVVSITNKLIA